LNINTVAPFLHPIPSPSPIQRKVEDTGEKGRQEGLEECGSSRVEGMESHIKCHSTNCPRSPLTFPENTCPVACYSEHYREMRWNILMSHREFNKLKQM
jgi:hypothetical protein